VHASSGIAITLAIAALVSTIVIAKRRNGKPMPNTAAYGNFANARYVDLHFLLLLNQKLPEQAFIEYVERYYDPPPASPEQARAEADHFRQQVYHIQWSRAVDSFQVYVTAVLREILRSRPEVMKSSEKLTFEEILNTGNFDSLVALMVEKVITPLAGFKALEAWFEKRKIPLVIADADRKILGEAIGTRNIIVHNAGVVNQRYVDEFAWRGFSVGQFRRIEFGELLELEKLLSKVVQATDSEIATKYKISAASPL
jgi:hypothetical protein